MERKIEIDFVRGLAVLFMIICHIGMFTIITLKNLNKNDKFIKSTLLFDIIGTIAHSLFIVLVGVNMVTSYNNTKNKIQKQNENNIQNSSENLTKIRINYTLKNIKRAAIIMIFGFVMSLIIRFVFKEWYVVFGIFQFISMSIILAIPFQLLYKPITILLAILVTSIIPILINRSNYGNVQNIILGNYTKLGVNYLDYFPLFPYFSFVLLGIFIGNTLRYPRFSEKQKKNNLVKHLSNNGKYSIQLYFLHLLLIFAIMRLILGKRKIKI